MKNDSTNCFVMSRKEFWAIAVFLVITRILDGVTTWLASPDLSDEQNFIIRNLSLGWGAVLFLGFLVILVMLILLQFGFKEQGRLFVPDTYNFKHYVWRLFWGKDCISWVDLLINVDFKRAFYVFFSLLIPVSLVCYSFFLIGNNLFMYFTYVWKSLDEFYMNVYIVFIWLHFIMPLLIIGLTFFALLKRGYLASKIKG